MRENYEVSRGVVAHNDDYYRRYLFKAQSAVFSKNIPDRILTGEFGRMNIRREQANYSHPSRAKKCCTFMTNNIIRLLTAHACKCPAACPRQAKRGFSLITIILIVLCTYIPVAMAY